MFRAQASREDYLFGQNPLPPNAKRYDLRCHTPQGWHSGQVLSERCRLLLQSSQLHVVRGVAISKTADLRAHQTVLVFGCGPIGVLCQAVAKAWGAKEVVGVDVVSSRIEVASSYGADQTFMPPKPEPGADPMAHAEKVATMLKEQCGLDDGADVVLECSDAEPCVQLGIYAAKRGATFVQAGMGKENVDFPITAVCSRGLVIKGPIRYLTGSYPAAIDLISSQRINVKPLITNRFNFEESEQAFELERQEDMTLLSYDYWCAVKEIERDYR